MMASKVNEGMRMKENSERLEWLQIHVDLHTEEKALQEKITFNSLTNSVGPRRSLFSCQEICPSVWLIKVSSLWCSEENQI